MLPLLSLLWVAPWLPGLFTAPTPASTPASPTPAALVVGERLHFGLRAGILGRIGEGWMWTQAEEEIRGVRTLRIRSEVRARALLVSVHDRHATWYAPVSEHAMRFHQDERGTFKPTRRREFDFFPQERRWSRSDAPEEGVLPHPQVLDELSFLYYVRTLPLPEGSNYTLPRHFEVEKNPVRIRVLHRSIERVPAGEFSVVWVGVKVRKSSVFGGGGGELEIALSDDARRLPVRIRTRVPLAGTVELELERFSRGE